MEGSFRGPDIDRRKTLTTPTIPLSPDVRASYEAVYAKNQTAIDSTNDFELLKSLNASQLDVGNLLQADDQYRIHADDAQFQAILTQINTTNAGLKALQAKISGIAGGISTFGAVVGAINQVLSLVPEL
jgi:hypothetical protein